MRNRKILAASWLALVSGCYSSVPAADADSGPLRDMDGGAIDSGADAGVPSGDASAVDAQAADAEPSVDAYIGVDAGTPETCSAEGERRTAACGSCGLRAETCTSGVWEATSACLDEGVCSPGSTESRATASCGEETRICNTECEWRDWSRTAPDGDCMPGATRVVTDGACGAGTWAQACSTECTWDVATCADPCRGMRRTSPWDAEEVCVPAGPFIRGHDDPDVEANFEPRAEVYVSTFLADRYPVTIRRYLECVDSGACSLPAVGDGPEVRPFGWRDPAVAEYPMFYIDAWTAEFFCGWDGGRRLLTEAEWEKAARGPSPREPADPWDSGATCDELGVCGRVWTQPDFSVRYAPGARSYYGVDLTRGGMIEWLRDLFHSGYYSDPSSRTDPQGPIEGERRDPLTGHFSRSTRGGSAYSEPYPLWRRGRFQPADRYAFTGIRCARSI